MLRRQLTCALSLLVAALSSAPAWGQDEIIVSNLDGDSATVYPRTGSGNVPPLRTLVGAATQLVAPLPVIVDTVHDELLVASAGLSSDDGSITVYPRGASGNTAPLRTIKGPSTGLAVPVDMALDPIRNELLVANADNATITVYARTANGDAAPLRTIGGPNTTLSIPQGLVLDLVHDELYVADLDGFVAVFPRGASGDVAPIRTLQGVATQLDGPLTPVLDLVRDEMWVVNGSSNALTVYPRTASGNTAPLRVLGGNATTMDFPIDAWVDTVNDELLVLNNGTNAVLVFPRSASGNVAPTRQIVGGATGIDGPAGIFVTTSPPLFAAVLPVSRSVQVGTIATVFATIINAGVGPGQMCFPVPIPSLSADYTFQTTNAQNQIVGTPNTPANIAAGGSQSFVLAFRPTAPFDTTNVAIGFTCEGVNRAAVVTGLTTVLLGASQNPVPDVIALAATAGNNGILELAGPAVSSLAARANAPAAVAAGAFAVATSNVGVAGTITVSADTGSAVLPVALAVCQTDGAGACSTTPASSVTVPIGAGATPTFAIFAASNAPIAFDPAGNRVFVRFAEGAVVRGATSVAIRTSGLAAAVGAP